MARWRTGLLFNILPIIFFISPLLAQRFKRLQPEQELHGEVLHNNETIVYHLLNLHSHTGYELRISYPATIPTDFVIEPLKDASLHKIGRKLLNIEKLVFTNEDIIDKYVSVRAVRVGVPVESRQLEDPVIYNIVLETLYLGLPFEVWKMGVLLALVTIVVITFGVPYVSWYVEEQCKKTVHQS